VGFNAEASPSQHNGPPMFELQCLRIQELADVSARYCGVADTHPTAEKYGELAAQLEQRARKATDPREKAGYITRATLFRKLQKARLPGVGGQQHFPPRPPTRR
jgi:hypothetical protein